MTSLVIEDGGADKSTVAWGRMSWAVNHCVLHRPECLPMPTPGLLELFAGTEMELHMCTCGVCMCVCVYVCEGLREPVVSCLQHPDPGESSGDSGCRPWLKWKEKLLCTPQLGRQCLGYGRRVII